VGRGAAGTRNRDVMDMPNPDLIQAFKVIYEPPSPSLIARGRQENDAMEQGEALNVVMIAQLIGCLLSYKKLP